MASRVARRSDPPDKGGSVSKRDRVSKSTETAPQSKRVRADVSDRRARNANTDISVIKCSFKSFCKAGAVVLPWESVLHDTNKAMAEAYTLANLHVLRLCHDQLAIPVLDQMFYYKCLSAVSVGKIARKHIPDEYFRASVDLYKASRGEETLLASSADISMGWFQNASLQMATNASNHVLSNFYPRLKKFAALRFGLKKSPLWTLLKDVLAATYEGVDDRVLELRGLILQDGSTQMDQVLKQPHTLLPVTFHFLRHIEEENARNLHDRSIRQLRAFGLLPFKRGFICSHLKMCSLGLYGLLKRGGVALPARGAEWNAVSDVWWRELFKISKFETATRKFAGEILTDGKAVSVVLRKPKTPPRTRGDVSTVDFGEVWGVDPGFRDMIVATSNHGRSISCSTPEFYEDAMYIPTTRTIRRWIARDPSFRDSCRRLPTRKTSSIDQLQLHISYLIPRLDELLGFCAAKPFRKLQLKRFIFKKRKLRQICLRLTETARMNTLIGFGDWSANNTDGFIKHCPSGPVKQLERELKRFCSVISIDEYRTSKLHANCHRELEHQWERRVCKDGVVHRSKVYSVLHCRHNGCFGTTVNRDQNASKNILSLTLPCFLGQDRDPAFCRPRT